MITRTEFQQIRVALEAMRGLVVNDERYVRHQDIEVLLATYVDGAVVDVKRESASSASVSVTLPETRGKPPATPIPGNGELRRTP
jgi:hypothetical protein